MMMSSLTFSLVLCFALFVVVRAAKLKTIGSSDVAKVSRHDEHLLVLFVSSGCELCPGAEQEVSTLLTSTYETNVPVTIVRVVDGDIPQTYGLKEPAVVFFRHQNPLIYDGQIEATALSEWIMYNQETALKILTDDDFEHYTQASSGSTTGDWLTIFCDVQTEACLRYQHVYESVAAKLKGRVNVAVIDTSRNFALAQRFSVEVPLSIFLFRLGKMYNYSVGKIDVASLTGFATGWYKNVAAVPVPVQPSPFDLLTLHIANLLKESNGTVYLVIIAVTVTIICAIWCAVSFKKTSEKVSKPSKKE